MPTRQVFTISPDKLIARCKDVVDKGIGVKRNEDLADDFVFQFPIVGPFNVSNSWPSYKSKSSLDE